MRKWNIIFSALFFVISVMPVFALTVSGTVYDATDPQNILPFDFAKVQAVDSDGNQIPNIGQSTDSDGRFNFNIPDDAKIQVSFVGYEKQIVAPGENLTVYLKTNRVLQEVISEPTECTENQEKDLKNNHNADEVKWENGRCVIKSCIGEPDEYQIQNNSCVKVNCNSAEIADLKRLKANDTEVVNGKCVIKSCIGEPGEYQIQNNSCVKVNCNSAEIADLNATNGKWNGKECIPTNCILKYELKGKKCVEIFCDETNGEEFDETNNKCVKNKCSQSEIQEILDANGTDPKWNGKKCVPTGCVANYHLNNKNKCVHDKCTKPEEDWDKKQQKCVQVRCSDEEIQAANATSKSKWVKNHCEFACDTDAGFSLSVQNKCEQTLCTKKDANRMIKNNVFEYELENGVCVAKTCISDDYEVNATKTGCDKKKCASPELTLVNGECKQTTKCSTEQLRKINAKDGYWDGKKCVATKCDEKIYTLLNGICDKKDKRSEEQKKKDLEEKQNAYEEAKAKEQSTANKIVTALSTAATGIGGMELAQGLAEQKSDKATDADMTAYIETMRCTYGDGKQVKAGPDEIELPGANNQELMNLRGQYLALAQDLKERKTALGMKPGIESETILDRASTGLYDDETIGINNGAYASLYRAKMLESEEDQKKIDDAASTSKKRVTGGAIAAGAGVVVGIAGNAIVNNSKLGEKLKGAVKDKKAGKETQKLLEKEEKALKDLRACLKSAGVKDADDLTFTEFYPSVLSAKKINCGKLKTNQNLSVDDMFADSTNATEVYNKLKDSFDTDTITKLIGYDTSNDSLAIRKIQSSIESVQDDFRNARDKDEKSASGLGIDLSDIKIDGDGISSISSLFGGDILSNITGGK